MAESVRPDAVMQKLQDSLDRGAGLCLLAGAGLTISATGDQANSWPELIKRGAVACQESGHRDRAWVNRVAADVRTGRTSDMLAAAEKVTRGFGEPDRGQFFGWLTEAIGSLEAKHFELLDEVKRLASHPRIAVVTTNYDSLLAKHLGFDLVTWNRGAPVLFDAFAHVFKAVIHIHGHWLEPESVVFGSASYATLSANQAAFEGLKRMMLKNMVVAVGVGVGIADPTFKVLLDWADKALESARGIYYLHIHGANVPDHPAIDRVSLPSYADLAKFLRQIQVRPPWPVLGPEKAGDRPSDPAASLRRVLDLASSSRQDEIVVRAQEYLNLYGDQVARVLSDRTTPDVRTKAWADRLLATWAALERA